MQTVQVVKHAGPDRVIHLSIPVDEAEQDYRLTVTIESENTGADFVQNHGSGCNAVLCLA